MNYNFSSYVPVRLCEKLTTTAVVSFTQYFTGIINEQWAKKKKKDDTQISSALLCWLCVNLCFCLVVSPLKEKSDQNKSNTL